MASHEIPSDIDPEIAAALRQTADLPVPDVTTMSPEVARQAYEESRRPWNVGGPRMARSEHGQIGGPGGPVPIVRHVPENAAGQPILYFHGGGWVLSSIRGHDGIMRRLAAGTRRPVIGIDYPLAPETRRPQLLAACMAAVDAIVASDGPVALAGDSAGGEIALSLALMRRDQGTAGVDQLVLLYPALWRRFETQSHRRLGAGEYGLSTAKMRRYWEHYLGTTTETLPEQPDLAGLPPTFVFAAGLDPLLDDALDIARLLAHASVPVELAVTPHAPHGFLHMGEVSALARSAHERIAAFLRGR